MTLTNLDNRSIQRLRTNSQRRVAARATGERLYFDRSAGGAAHAGVRELVRVRRARRTREMLMALGALGIGVAAGVIALSAFGLT